MFQQWRSIQSCSVSWFTRHYFRRSGRSSCYSYLTVMPIWTVSQINSYPTQTKRLVRSSLILQNITLDLTCRLTTLHQICIDIPPSTLNSLTTKTLTTRQPKHPKLYPCSKSSPWSIGVNTLLLTYRAGKRTISDYAFTN